MQSHSRAGLASRAPCLPRRHRAALPGTWSRRTNEARQRRPGRSCHPGSDHKAARRNRLTQRLTVPANSHHQASFPGCGAAICFRRRISTETTPEIDPAHRCTSAMRTVTLSGAPTSSVVLIESVDRVADVRRLHPSGDSLIGNDARVSPSEQRGDRYVRERCRSNRGVQRQIRLDPDGVGHAPRCRGSGPHQLREAVVPVSFSSLPARQR